MIILINSLNKNTNNNWKNEFNSQNLLTKKLIIIKIQ